MVCHNTPQVGEFVGPILNVCSDQFYYNVRFMCFNNVPLCRSDILPCLFEPYSEPIIVKMINISDVHISNCRCAN